MTEQMLELMRLIRDLGLVVVEITNPDDPFADK